MTLKHYILDENHNHVEVDLMTWSTWFEDKKKKNGWFRYNWR